MDNNMYGDTTKHSGTCTMHLVGTLITIRDRLSCNFVILHNQVRKDNQG